MCCNASVVQQLREWREHALHSPQSRLHVVQLLLPSLQSTLCSLFICCLFFSCCLAWGIKQASVRVYRSARLGTRQMEVQEERVAPRSQVCMVSLPARSTKPHIKSNSLEGLCAKTWADFRKRRPRRHNAPDPLRTLKFDTDLAHRA